MTSLQHVVDTAPGAVLALLPYALPLLKDRLIPSESATAPPEPSEARLVALTRWCQGECPLTLSPRLAVQELRVLLLRLARALVQHAQASLPAYGADFVQLLSGALQDTTPDVAIAACDCCCSLASTLQRRLGAQNAVLLAEGATLHTSSTRAAVRRAALDAVHQLVLCGAHEHLLTMSAYQHPNQVDIAAFYGKQPVQVNWLGKLATDHNAGVRSRLITVLTDWMLHLPERVDHTPRLLPFVLSGLTDGTNDVVAATTTALGALGRAYEADHVEELAQLMRFAPQALPAGDVLPVGVRLLVQDHLPALLPPCLADMRVWNTDVRPRAVALLKTVLGLAGDKAARFAPMLLAALCTCLDDPDAVVAQGARDCLSLLAVHVAPDALIQPLVLLAQDKRRQAITALTVMRDAALPGAEDAFSAALTQVS